MHLSFWNPQRSAGEGKEHLMGRGFYMDKNSRNQF